MKKSFNFLLITIAFIGLSALRMPAGKLVSKTGHINFFSHTVAEDISSDNFKVTSTLDTETGAVVFSVPMQSFEFEKALMQKHFNSKNFLNTKEYPKAKFVGKIVNVDQIDFTKDGTYDAKVDGELTIKGVTNTIAEKGVITVSGNEIMTDSKFQIALQDYGIAFEKGKPSTNVAKEIDITIKSVFTR